MDQISLAVKLCQPASIDEYNTRKIGHLVFWVYIYILARFPVQKYKLEILRIKILTALRARKNAPNLLQFFTFPHVWTKCAQPGLVQLLAPLEETKSVQ